MGRSASIRVFLYKCFPRSLTYLNVTLIQIFFLKKEIYKRERKTTTDATAEGKSTELNRMNYKIIPIYSFLPLFNV